jgi:hypothetical protein
MSIAVQLDELFSQWQARYGSLGRQLVRDGMIGTEAQWLSARPRCLFLLKEPNDRNEVLTACGYDLCRLFRRSGDFGQNRKTVERTIVQWFGDLRALWGLPRLDFDQAICSCSVINIKKLGGSGRTKASDIRRFANQDAWFIAREIELLQPEVVICGGTADAIRNAWTGFESWGSDKLCFRRGAVLWLDHFHPAAWAGKSKRHAQVVSELKLLVDCEPKAAV